MRLIEVNIMEDCLKGTLTLIYLFDLPWHKEAILKLSHLGRLDYFEDFPRPFFRLSSFENVQMKGINGENTCRVIYPAENREKVHFEFEQKLIKLLEID